MKDTTRRRALTVSALWVAATLATACDNDGGPAVPGVVTNVTVATLSPTRAQVTWNDVAGADEYIVERAAGATGDDFTELATVDANTYLDETLVPSTVYRYRIAASNSQGQGNFSSIATHSAPSAFSATISTDITANRTLFADTTYTLSGFIHVSNGATLTIQPGTVIKGDFNALGSSLFILRGAQIRAMGTADRPIVFTSSRPVGQRQPGDWGGLIIVGNARGNRTGALELEGTGTVAGDVSGTNYAVTYGNGTNDADNSGELHYVRVEFAGYGPAPAAELNSFTFAAVGSGTQLDHLQSLAGLDDSFEWFGGTVDARYLVSYESGDDHFDASEGFRGRVQFMIAYQSEVLVPRTGAGDVSGDPQGIENDGCAGAGCTNGELSTPLTAPLFANFTLIGTGPGHVDATSGGYGMVLRRGMAGWYVNGVIARWPKSAISIRDAASTGTHITSGELVVRNILAADNAALFQSGQLTVDATANAITSATAAASALFQVLPAAPASAESFDWTPAAGSAAASGGLAAFTGTLATKAGTFVTATTYRGAADPNGDDWWAGWTSYAGS